MIFKCFPKYRDSAAGKRRVERLTNWHRWFAWQPVRIDIELCVWLETVERKFNTDLLLSSRYHLTVPVTGQDDENIDSD